MISTLFNNHNIWQNRILSIGQNECEKNRTSELSYTPGGKVLMWKIVVLSAAPQNY